MKPICKYLMCFARANGSFAWLYIHISVNPRMDPIFSILAFIVICCPTDIFLKISPVSVIDTPIIIPIVKTIPVTQKLYCSSDLACGQHPLPGEQAWWTHQPTPVQPPHRFPRLRPPLPGPHPPPDRRHDSGSRGSSSAPSAPHCRIPVPSLRREQARRQIHGLCNGHIINKETHWYTTHILPILPRARSIFCRKVFLEPTKRRNFLDAWRSAPATTASPTSTAAE